ncbi:GNAT family N-acetyltransferase [Paenibacillus methanolicus]|uniref:GNAT family N-acetyltransferase n=1 Tax=Paenibacillus methanolicus TaxID=582686 RepID=UPI0016531B12|nr:GNAT family N-acetyltransferase [Paenibacillus methanolicus]
MTRSKRMLLRRTHPQDISAILEMERHPDNERFVHQWEPEEHMAAVRSERHLHIVIENLSGRPIGYMIAAGFQPESDEMELIRLVVGEKGKGYGKEALKLIMGLVFRELNKKRLWLDVRASNERARNLYVSVGFYEEPARQRTVGGDLEEALLAMTIGEAEYFGKHAR